MTSLLNLPNVNAALQRASMFPPSSDVIERLRSACEHPDVQPDGILEISRADWGTEE